ncbi:NUDIX hydrolase [Catenuloplanes indicus]|uniref:8-oxo-dGTP pyrophosphatase MutT (NUDIX family) n=1 Tax=Catenuloplanes indicus TaxID=137267 RepID=A0AAE3VYV7_9ACTN|nr:NUDIX domain-containing protein [Catenuloplanes indicus]MDQ0366266.1 8-oxo-dGTP pyrophosphatase MutT (NUDIX family) [Catenuloplanes indicus]
MALIKHATASVFLFARLDGGWRIGLIRHPRFARWMLPGGHVEAHENPAEAALREVREETGLTATLMLPYANVVPDYPAAANVPIPVWITEQIVPPESRLPSDHVHVDHLYLAVAERAITADNPELPFRWCAPDDLPALDMFPDTRNGAKLVLPLLDGLTALSAGTA